MTTLCQPCEPLSKDLVRKWSRLAHGFYLKSGRWYCPCKKQARNCTSIMCKRFGKVVNIKVGGSMCEHSTQRSQCKKCDGISICEHNIRRSHCKKCNGSCICEHNIQRSQCKKCNGGSICEHNRISYTCRECGGNIICKHNKRRSQCIKCNPNGYIANQRRIRRSNALKTKNPTHTIDELGMTSKEWYAYLSKTFEDRYGRPRNESDDVHIDEIIPCSAWNIPDDNKYCWHYLNSQWLLANDNLSKGSSYTQTDKDEMIKRIDVALSQLKE